MQWEHRQEHTELKWGKHNRCTYEETGENTELNTQGVMTN